MTLQHAIPIPGMLHPAGPAASPLASLGWVLLAISVVVVVVVSALVLTAVLRAGEESTAVRRSGRGLSWIMVGGLVVPTVILTIVFVLTVRTLGAASPPARSAATIQVVGHRWWWEIRYLDSLPADIAVTANELHLPVGRPVVLTLEGPDVIHSFWVPELAGKTDLIPGQHNIAWLEADHPGVYWGTCGEYCGLEHARMQLTVVAEPPAAFRRWLDRQRQAAGAPGSSAALAGQGLVTEGACALCHTVRGTTAGGRLGPDLTHVASRRMLAAGAVANSRGGLTAWIADPQGLKPGSAMPAVGLSGPELQAVVAYLETLR
jgi:cytochrome c oxidase subunit II